MVSKSKKLHIGIIQQTPDVGGAETYMVTLMRSFLADGHTVTLATNNTKFAALAKPLQIPLYHIPVILDIMGNLRGLIKSMLYLPYAWWYYRGLLKTYKQKNVDVLFMSGFSEKLLVTYLAGQQNIPVVWLEHGPLQSILKRNFGLPGVFYKRLVREASVVIAPSRHTVRSLIRDAGVPKEKAVWIPDGVEGPLLSKKKTGEKKKDDFIIGNVSRLTREKGQQYLIKAMPEVLKAVPNAKAVIIGTGWDETYFQSIIDALQLSETVELVGYVDDLDRYYDMMDVFVFPTVWELEGFGLVSVEAMLHRLPVIGSNAGPVPEVIDDGETGLLVPPHDPKAIAESIIRLARNEALRKKMGEAGYKKAATVYNSKKIAAQFIDHFYMALEPNP